MAVTQYIGSRYVPLFADPIEWSSSNTYEPLTIVIHEGNSYTSKQAVPKGIDIANEAFWALTGNYNAQVELYRRETAAAKAAADDAQADATAAQTDIDTLLPKADFSAENTVKKYVDDSVSAVQTDIDTLLPKADFSAENTVKKYVDDSVKEAITRNLYAPIYFAGRLVDRFGYENRERTMFSQSVCYSETSQLYYVVGDLGDIQGICVFDHNGNYVNGKRYTQLGHGQSITIYDDMLVVVPQSGSDICLVNRTTLDYIRTITLAGNITNIYALDVFDNNLYLHYMDENSNKCIGTIDLDSGTVDRRCIVQSVTNQVTQGLCVLNDRAYILYNYENEVFELDINTGRLIKGMKLPTGDGYFPIGEPEDMFSINGRIYFNAAQYYETSFAVSAAVCYLFELGANKVATSPVNNLQSDRTFTINANPNNNTAFKAINNLNTIEECGFIANYHKGAHLRIGNFTKGAIMLHDGDFYIDNPTGYNTFDAIVVENSKLTARQISSNISLDGCVAFFTDCQFNGLTARYSNIDGITIKFKEGAYSIAKSKLTIELIGLENVTFTNASSCYMRVVGTGSVVQNFDCLLGTYYNKIVLFTVCVTGNILTGKATSNQIASGNFRVATQNVNYPYLSLHDGNIYIVKPDSSEVLPSAQEAIIIETVS